MVLTRVRLPVVACAALLLTMFASPSAQGLSLCDGTWASEQVPQGPLARPYQFATIAVTGPGDVWLAGEAPTATGTVGLVAHRHGGRWDLTRVPAVAGFTAIAAVPGSVWAVARDASSAAQVLRLVGTTWRTVPLGLAGGQRVQSISSTSASDVWVAGTSFDGTVEAAFALHFDGSHWRRTIFEPGSTGADVDVGDGSEAWVVGSSTVAGVFGTDNPTSWHWKDGTWTKEVVPGYTDLPIPLTSVTALRDGTVWASGFADDGGHAEVPAVAQHTAAGWRDARSPGLDRSTGKAPLAVTAGRGSAAPTLYGFLCLCLCDGGSAEVHPVLATLEGSTWVEQGVRGLSDFLTAHYELSAADGDGRGGTWSVGVTPEPTTGAFVPILVHRCS